jgi:hypothetical protein
MDRSRPDMIGGMNCSPSSTFMGRWGSADQTIVWLTCMHAKVGLDQTLRPLQGQQRREEIMLNSLPTLSAPYKCTSVSERADD